MKVEFKSSKERNPLVEDELSVLYAPAKRTAYKVRWYLILAVVFSPIVYFIINLIFDVLVISVPATLSTGQMELRSSSRGFVDEILVDFNQSVTAGDIVLKLKDNNLSDNLEMVRARKDYMLAQTEYSNSQKQIDLANKQLQLVKKYHAGVLRHYQNINELFEMSAATQAERRSAGIQLDQSQRQVYLAEKELLDIQGRYASFGGQSGVGSQVNDAEVQEKLLGNELANLNQRVNVSGKVLDIFVDQGEFVDIGTPILVISQEKTTTATVYLDVRYISYAKLDQAVKVIMPNGSRYKGYVSHVPQSTKRLPSELTSFERKQAFAILVEVSFYEPLPLELKVDKLPVKVVF